MREAAADERFEEAARYRNRLYSIRHLSERQAADRRAVGSVDVIGLAVDGRTGGGPGVPAPRREDDRPLRLPPRERRAARTSRPCSRRSSIEYYGTVAEHPAGGARARGRRRTRRDRRVPLRAARRAGRRAGAAARREAAARRPRASRTRVSRSTPTPRSGRRRGRGASRRSRSSARCSTSRACRCGSSASTSRTSRASRSSRRWSSSRTGARGTRTTAASRSAGSTGRTTSARCARRSGAASRGLAQGDVDESFSADRRTSSSWTAERGSSRPRARRWRSSTCRASP